MIRLPFWLRNLPYRLRPRALYAEVRALARIGVNPSLSLTLTHADGRVERLGRVGRLSVTNGGVAWLASTHTNLAEPETLNYHDVGTDATAENPAQTALGASYGGGRVTGAQSNPGATNLYRSVATFTFAGPFVLREHGIFTAGSGGTMFDRTMFAAINVDTTVQVTATWELTYPSGG